MKHPVLTLMALAIAIAAPGAVKAQSAQQLQEKEAALQASRAKAGSARQSITTKDLVAYAGTTVASGQGVGLVIATGGLSIPKIGASDFGYRLARQFGRGNHLHRNTRDLLGPAQLHALFDGDGTGGFGGLAHDELRQGMAIVRVYLTRRGGP